MAAAHTAELGRLTTGDTGKSGIAQIHNPWARIPLQIADAIGGGLFPGIEQRLPGTEGHHQILVREAQKDVAGDEAAAANEAKDAQMGAESNEANARAYSLEHPADKNAGSTITTDKGIMQWNPETQSYDIAAGQTPEKPIPPHYTAMPDGSVVGISADPKTGEMTAHVVYKGDPRVETVVTSLEKNGKQHQVVINKATGEEIKDLGETGQKAPTINVNAGTAALDRESGRFAKTWEKEVANSNAQLEKINEAQGMINGNAESQALGIPKVLTALVSGQGTGVRITQAELNGIGHARGIIGDVEGTLRKLSGKGQLSRQQQQELNGILEDVKGLILRKQQIANDALDAINSGENREAIVNADKDARKRLADLQVGKPGGAMITVQIPGFPPGKILASQKAEFLKKHPNAKVE